MNTGRLIFLTLSSLVFSCQPPSKSEGSLTETDQRINTFHIFNPNGQTINERFNPPDGFMRTKEDSGSFATYLRTLPLKPNGSLVHTYDGYIKDSTDVYVAVVDMDIGNKDLQQCADIVMRLKAEYLYRNKDYERIHFNFVNGFNAEYAKWAEGYRIKIQGNNTWWVQTADPGVDYESFQKYLEWVYMYAGTASLWKELIPISDLKEIKIGDIFITGGSPGHAVIVVDLSVNHQTGDKAYILAQSYMPAQEIQILINRGNHSISPWYLVSEVKDILWTPEWTFPVEQLMRFPE
ncbi:DUF4846 domain-containing protein [Bacteroidota bacterium]